MLQIEYLWSIFYQNIVKFKELIQNNTNQKELQNIVNKYMKQIQNFFMK